MAAVRKEAPAKSFFSSPSHTLKKLVNAFPKAQKQSHHISHHQQKGKLHQHPQQTLAIDCVGEEDDDEDDFEDDVAELDAIDGYGTGATHISASVAAEEDGVDAENVVDDDTEYSGSSEGEYPRPRIRKDLLPHDFSEWQKSSSIAPYSHSEASSTSREAESFSEVLSSSTSQDHRASQDKCATQDTYSRSNGRVEYHSNPSPMEQNRNSSYIEPHRYPSPTLTSARGSIPAADLHLHKIRQNLPDLKLDIGLSGACRYGGPAGLKGLPEDRGSVLNGASEDGRRNSADSACWQRRIVPELVVTGGQARETADMIPLIEAYRVHQEDGHQRGYFQHHASMVYTRAPSRKALAKKVADSMNSRRVSRNNRKVKKKSDVMWEEQENLPRRVKANDLSRSPRRVSYENSVDIAKLQSQVEELQRKLVVREGVQHGVVESRDESSEMLLIMRRLEELQRKVAERDQMLESANEAIIQKEDEIQAMKKRLQDTEETCSALRSRNANREEEVRALRCEVAALRWQIEIETEKTRNEVETSVQGVNDTCGCTDLRKQGAELEVCEMEAVRKMYLAALVVARHVPKEECLALVGVLRIQLQRILRIPTSHLP